MVDRRRSTVTADSMGVWEAGGRADGASITQIAIANRDEEETDGKSQKELEEVLTMAETVPKSRAFRLH